MPFEGEVGSFAVIFEALAGEVLLLAAEFFYLGGSLGFSGDINTLAVDLGSFFAVVGLVGDVKTFGGAVIFFGVGASFFL